MKGKTVFLVMTGCALLGLSLFPSTSSASFSPAEFAKCRRPAPGNCEVVTCTTTCDWNVRRKNCPCFE